MTPLALGIVASWLSRPIVRRELVEEFPCEIEASQALEVVAQAKRQLSGPIKVIETGAWPLRRGASLVRNLLQRPTQGTR